MKTICYVLVALLNFGCAKNDDNNGSQDSYLKQQACEQRISQATEGNDFEMKNPDAFLLLTFQENVTDSEIGDVVARHGVEFGLRTQEIRANENPNSVSISIPKSLDRIPVLCNLLNEASISEIKVDR